MKGYSAYCAAEPAYAIPNSWKEGDPIDVKLEKYLTKLNDLKNEFRKSKENFDNLFQTGKRSALSLNVTVTQVFLLF